MKILIIETRDAAPYKFGTAPAPSPENFPGSGSEQNVAAA